MENFSAITTEQQRAVLQAQTVLADPTKSAFEQYQAKQFIGAMQKQMGVTQRIDGYDKVMKRYQTQFPHMMARASELSKTGVGKDMATASGGRFFVIPLFYHVNQWIRFQLARNADIEAAKRGKTWPLAGPSVTSTGPSGEEEESQIVATQLGQRSATSVVPSREGTQSSTFSETLLPGGFAEAASRRSTLLLTTPSWSNNPSESKNAVLSYLNLRLHWGEVLGGVVSYAVYYGTVKGAAAVFSPSPERQLFNFRSKRLLCYRPHLEGPAQEEGYTLTGDWQIPIEQAGGDDPQPLLIIWTLNEQSELDPIVILTAQLALNTVVMPPQSVNATDIMERGLAIATANPKLSPLVQEWQRWYAIPKTSTTTTGTGEKKKRKRKRAPSAGTN